jgi:hypothetical protein
MFNQIVFSSIDQALNYLNISPETTHIRMIDHEYSENIIRYNDKTISVMGIGHTIHPGYPKCNHSWLDQRPILDKLEKDGYIDVFIQYNYHKNTTVYYLGQYCFENYKKQIAKNGFVYFQFNLEKIV